MRYLLLALLLAGAAWGEAQTYCFAGYVGPITGAKEDAEWAITITGTADGFRVVYETSYYEVEEITGVIPVENWYDYIEDGKLYIYTQDVREFTVESLDDIRPTPAEMRKAGK